MDDPAIVTAIAAGELGGLAAAVDRYAAALYEYCCPTAPAVAADAVRDTFVIAWSKLDGLRDPARLYPWLQAVAGNECRRRARAGGPAGAQAGLVLEPALPPGLPGQVLGACADNTPAGRAHRVSVAYRAGPFGRDGFPKTGPRPRGQRLRVPGLPDGLRGRRAGAAAAAVAVLVVASAIVAGLPSGGPRLGQAAASAGGQMHAEAPASGASLPTRPARPARPIRSSAGRRSSPATPVHPNAQSPNGAVAARALPPAMAGAPATGTLATPPAAPMATVMPGPAAAPVPGVLSAGQNLLHFVSVKGGNSTRTFVITAEDGPVTGYTIVVPAGLPGRLTVSPSSGSLADGESATITVTAASTVPFVTSLTVHPGGAVIALDVKASPNAPGKRKTAKARTS